MINALWHDWHAGWSWGPRFLAPFLPFWLLPAAFWLQESKGKFRSYIGVTVVCLSVVSQVPSVLVRDQQLLHIEKNMLSHEDRQAVYSMYPMAWAILVHKLSHTSEEYTVEQLGGNNSRTVDLNEFETSHGFNIWTEHLARKLNQPAVRAVPMIGLLFLIGVFAFHRYRRRSVGRS